MPAKDNACDGDTRLQDKATENRICFQGTPGLGGSREQDHQAGSKRLLSPHFTGLLSITLLGHLGGSEGVKQELQPHPPGSQTLLLGI